MANFEEMVEEESGAGRFERLDRERFLPFIDTASLHAVWRHSNIDRWICFLVRNKFALLSGIACSLSAAADPMNLSRYRSGHGYSALFRFHSLFFCTHPDYHVVNTSLRHQLSTIGRYKRPTYVQKPPDGHGRYLRDISFFFLFYWVHILLDTLSCNASLRTFSTIRMTFQTCSDIT